MALLTEIQISIGGYIIPVIESFSLQEQVGDHATFTIAVRNDVLETSIGDAALLENSKDFLGQSCTIQVQDLKGILAYENLQFKGIVTRMNSSQGDQQGHPNMILIEGMSSSIILDDGPHMSSALDLDVTTILENALGIYDQSKLTLKLVPEDTGTIAYSVQNGQSGFQYMQHLAATRGEYLLYAKDTLYFGKPDLGDDIILQYGYDLIHFSLGLQTKPGKFTYYSNDYFEEETAQGSTTSGTSTGQGYAPFASRISNNMFQNETQLPYPSYEDPQLKQRMDKSIALQKKVIEQNQVSISGKSTNTGVMLGKVIKIQNEKGAFGRYRVTKVSHSCNNMGNYQNEFTAIPMDIDIYPLTDINKISTTGVQIAKVLETDDPQGMSRIKVQYEWQKARGGNTPWIRVATPYAGGERGFHFIPEPGDSVLISHEQNNILKPYMQAALYTGVNKHSGWQSQNNDYKGFTTKAGHIVELNDTKGSEMITITDKNSNVIRIDTANNNIEISALENMTLNAKNIKIKAEENIEMVAGNDFTKSVSENYNVMTKNNTLIVEEKLTTDSKQQENVSDEITLSSNKKNLTLSSGKMVDVQSKEKVKLF